MGLTWGETTDYIRYSLDAHPNPSPNPHPNTCGDGHGAAIDGQLLYQQPQAQLRRRLRVRGTGALTRRGQRRVGIVERQPLRLDGQVAQQLQAGNA